MKVVSYAYYPVAVLWDLLLINIKEAQSITRTTVAQKEMLFRKRYYSDNAKIYGNYNNKTT